MKSRRLTGSPKAQDERLSHQRSSVVLCIITNSDHARSAAASHRRAAKLIPKYRLCRNDRPAAKARRQEATARQLRWQFSAASFQWRSGVDECWCLERCRFSTACRIAGKNCQPGRFRPDMKCTASGAQAGCLRCSSSIRQCGASASALAHAARSATPSCAGKCRDEFALPHCCPQSSQRDIVAGQTGRTEVAKLKSATSAKGLIEQQKRGAMRVGSARKADTGVTDIGRNGCPVPS